MADESTGLQGAADRIREAAKWLTVSLAAIGGVLVAGLQLSSVGKLDSGSTRFWLAVLGGAGAAVGAVIMLIATTSVMTSPAVSIESVARKTPAGTSRVVTDPTLLNGYADVGALRDEYLAAVQQRTQAQRDYLGKPADSGMRTAAETANARAVAVSDITRDYLRVVSYQRLAHRWRVAAAGIVVGGVLAGTGIGVFAWSANPPDTALASAARPGILTAPTQAKLTLTSVGVESLRGELGAACDTSKPISVLLLADTAAGPDVLTDQAPSCQRIRFILVAAWGTVSV